MSVADAVKVVREPYDEGVVQPNSSLLDEKTLLNRTMVKIRGNSRGLAMEEGDLPAAAIHGLYAIIDPRFLPKGYRIDEYALELLQGGCRLLQLRVKDRGDAESRWAREKRYAAARALTHLRRRYDFTLIINDDLECAKELHADGVHLGKDDLPISKARAEMPRNFIIGYSAHSIAEAIAAERNGADYVALGAIFPTTTKSVGYPLQGVERLAETVNSLRVPVVAIGGINADNIGMVLETGVAAVAMITALSSAANIEAVVSSLVNRFKTNELGTAMGPRKSYDNVSRRNGS